MTIDRELEDLIEEARRLEARDVASPTPEEIAAGTEEIRSEWTHKEYKKRTTSEYTRYEFPRHREDRRRRGE